MNALAPIASNADAYRASTDAAGLCREIVLQTAKPIQGKRYVGVEGWQAIAIAHGCAASADAVERVTDEGMSGFKATGIVRRMSDGAEIARGEGFLGDDERMWSGRPVYARRAMVQTRAISRACRSAFAHVVVMIDAGLSTTPAEEVPHEGFDNGNVVDVEPTPAQPPAKAKDAPFPQGPAKNKTDLKAQGREFWRQVEGCGDSDELDALIASHTDLVKQLRAALPEWWEGGNARNGEPFEGLGEVITRKQTEFANEAWKRNPVSGG